MKGYLVKRQKGDVMNTFVNALNTATNYKTTENGALAHKSTNSAVYDMFALGGAYRSRSEDDIRLMFEKAYNEDSTLALKCLFYIGDCRGGQGERRFFRVAFNWFCQTDPVHAGMLIEQIPEYRRWDDVLYATEGTKVFSTALHIIRHQLALDVDCRTPSLLAKWLPSENASSAKTKAMANKVRKFLGFSHKQYRKTLSLLRTRINVLEKLMSSNQWDKIEFDKIPSKAGLIYKNAFARRDIIAKKYEAFAKDETTKVNAATLYPYEVVHKAREGMNYSSYGRNAGFFGSDTDRAMINKYWENLPDYLNGINASMLCMIDTSGSMTCSYGNSSVAPIDVAISLGLYTAERMSGPFANQYISFASRPQLIKTDGIDFVDKVRRIYQTNLVDNTNLTAAFELLLNVATQPGVKPADIPSTIVVISDMEIDCSIRRDWRNNTPITTLVDTEMEAERKRWAARGVKMPRLVYWNVNARNDTILDASPNVSYVSGCSPVIYEAILSGKTGFDLMLAKLNSKRYEAIH